MSVSSSAGQDNVNVVAVEAVQTGALCEVRMDQHTRAAVMNVDNMNSSDALNF